MKILFADKKLEKLLGDFRKCSQVMGEKRAKLLVVRLNALRDARSLEDVRCFPGRFHELVANRKGQWSCDLDHPYRLIFEPLENPIPKNAHGQFEWIRIKGVSIIEITDYH